MKKPPPGTVLDTFDVNGALHELVQGDPFTTFTRPAEEMRQAKYRFALAESALRAQNMQMQMAKNAQSMYNNMYSNNVLQGFKQPNRDRMMETERQTNLDRFFGLKPDYIALSKVYGGYMFIHNRRNYNQPSGRIGFVTRRMTTWREGGKWYKYNVDHLDRAIDLWGNKDTTEAEMILRAIA